jgi:WD40 repeat protein
LLAVLSGNNVVRVLDTSDGRQDGEAIKLTDAEANTVALSPDGATIAVGGDDGTTRLFSRRHGGPIGQPMRGPQYRVISVMFSDDGSRLYSHSFDAIRIWDNATQKAINTVDTVTAVTAMALSPDGKRLAVADNNYIQEWDADGGKTVGPVIKGRGHAAEDIGYGGGGRYLVTIGTDQTVRFWDLAAGTQLGDAVDVTAAGMGEGITFSADDRRVFITARGIWQVPGPAGWADALCDKLVANPTEEQWKSWVSADPNIGYTDVCPGKSPAS